MGKRNIIKAFMLIILFIAVLKIAIGACTSPCVCSDNGAVSGLIYAKLFVCKGTACEQSGTTQTGAAIGVSDIGLTNFAIDWLNHCDMGEGTYDIYFQTHNTTGIFPALQKMSDGNCTIKNVKTIDYNTLDFCKSNCMTDRTPAWVNGLGCCGETGDPKCGIYIGGGYICSQASSVWNWNYKENNVGKIISYGCKTGQFAATGTGFTTCEEAGPVVKPSIDNNAYLCNSNALYECIVSTPSPHGNIAPNAVTKTNSQAGYYCLRTEVGSATTKWENAPACTFFCQAPQSNQCCTDAGTLVSKPAAYVSGLTICNYPSGCDCNGWTFSQNPTKPTCVAAGTLKIGDPTQCCNKSGATECNNTDPDGWTDCVGEQYDTDYANCPGAEDGPGGNGYNLSNYCYYTNQVDSCTATGWACTAGTSALLTGLGTIVGGVSCRFDVDKTQGDKGCLKNTGWVYLDDPSKATCYNLGQISPDGKCFTSPRSSDRCDVGIGWNCDNGTFEAPAEKPTTCTYHTGTQCTGTNPDCILHYGCTGEKCSTTLGVGWECFGGINPSSPNIDTACTAECTDCDMNNQCDSEQISVNPALDADNDGILNVCDREVDISSCDDGRDNDLDGTCDELGCYCTLDNQYCGTNVGPDRNMPRDDGCGVVCTTCEMCGDGTFNVCDLAECNTCNPGNNCAFHDLFGPLSDYCCLDIDSDTYCEDAQSPIDKCPSVDDRTDVDQDGSSADDDIYRDCLDEYLLCDLDSQCKSYGWGDEGCSCPDCNLSSFPCSAFPGTVCIQLGDKSTWECMNWDASQENCEMHNLASTQGICDAHKEKSCWDGQYLGNNVNYAPCCGDDAGSDIWKNDSGAGCSMGEFYLDSDADTTGILCNFIDATQTQGIDCWESSQDICWYLEPTPACCGDDALEYKTFNNLFDEGPNVACCPRTNDYAASNGKCIPQSAYDHPDDSSAELTFALGSAVGDLDEGDIYPYNQTVTLVKAGDVSLFEITGLFSELTRPDSTPPVNNGAVNLSGLRIQDDGASIYINATWLKQSKDSNTNRISNEYALYVPNLNDGIGLTVCTDPQLGNADYGEECQAQTTFTRPATLNSFKLEISEDFYKITTSLDVWHDWYVFVHVQPSLKIESDADLMTKRSYENVGFYADLQSGSPITDAACKIFYHDGLNVTMQYNTTFQKYYHERTYTGKGLYSWEVKCSHPFYLPVSSSKMASIKPNSELIIYDITDSKTRMIDEEVEFFAFYRSLPGQAMLASASCSITYHDEDTDTLSLRTDENGEQYFGEDRLYANYGTFSYYVKCENPGYDTITAVDTVDIFPTTCNITKIGEDALVPGKSIFNVISKRGFVLLKKAE